MIHLDCARRVAAISLTAILILSAGAADARSRVPVPTPRPSLDSEGASAAAIGPMPAPTFSIISTDDAALPVTDDASGLPTVVKSVRRIFCVEYARLRSGIAIFGDAKTWWEKARGLYAEGAAPLPGAVMVFAETKKMKRGHVAVVTRIVSSREIRVDHANWRRDGNIYLNTPVMDVSAANDWSQVRVWDTPDGQLGSRTYPVKGFVSFRTSAMN